MNKTDFSIFTKLEEMIKTRRREDTPETSYVAKMFDKGLDKIAQKVGEEGVEVVIASLRDDDGEFIYEGADLLFHLMMLCEARNVPFGKLVEELENRAENGKGVYKNFVTGEMPEAK